MSDLLHFCKNCWMPLPASDEGTFCSYDCQEQFEDDMNEEDDEENV